MTNILKENNTSIVVFVILILCTVILLPSIGVLIAFLIVMVIIIFNRRNSILKSIGFRSPKNWLRVIFICLSFGLIIELSFQIFFNPVVEHITNSTIDVSAFDNVRGNFTPYMIWLLIGWVVGGMIEETIFRGYLITRLIKILGDKSIILVMILFITSVPFGLSHFYQGWAGVLNTGTTSIILGLVFIRSEYNIWYSILTHGFINSVGFTLIFLDLDKFIRSVW